MSAQSIGHQISSEFKPTEVIRFVQHGRFAGYWRRVKMQTGFDPAALAHALTMRGHIARAVVILNPDAEVR